MRILKCNTKLINLQFREKGTKLEFAKNKSIAQYQACPNEPGRLKVIASKTPRIAPSMIFIGESYNQNKDFHSNASFIPLFRHFIIFCNFTIEF